MAEGDLQRIVGQNIAAIRRDKGLSQEAFADLIGFHRTYVGGLERGERNLSLQAVERLAAILGTEPLALFVLPSSAPRATDLAIRSRQGVSPTGT